MSFRLFLNYWILKWLSCLKLPLSKLYSIFSRFLLESYYLVHKPLMTVMLIKLKLLNVEFKALHVITPVHHSRQSRKKKDNLPTLHFSSHIFSYNTAKTLTSDSYSAFLCMSYYFKAPRNIPSVVSDHQGDNPYSFSS